METASYLKIAAIWVVVLLLAIGGYFGWTKYKASKNTPSNINSDITDTSVNPKDNSPDFENIGPLTTGDDSEGIDTKGKVAVLKGATDEKSALKASTTSHNPDDKTAPFNILILGIDRRSGDQTHWRTDVIQLVTLSTDRTKAALTHIPRDVWAGNYKINAIYNLQGPDAIKDQVQAITGQRPDRIIRVDFDAFAWAIDSVGGLTIDVPNSFTDTQYPNDRKGVDTQVTIEFKKGQQTMDGETALEYVRSRHGGSGEGSDYARGLRQQYVMQAIIDDYFKPDNLFRPKTAETLFKIATQKVYTDVTMQDMPVLYDLLKNYTRFKMTNLSLDTSNYLIVPNAKDYGGAWTLIAKGNDYSPIHKKIEELIAK